MYGLTLAALGRDYQCVVWCLRAFAEFIRVLRGQIISVRPPVRRWFVTETLFALGQSYSVVEDGQDQAVHYLALAKNMVRAAPDDEMDIQQTFKVTNSTVALSSTFCLPEKSHVSWVDMRSVAASGPCRCWIAL